MAFSISYIIKAIDQFTPHASTVAGAMAKIEAQAAKAAKSTQALDERMVALKMRAVDLQGQMLGAAASLYVFAQPIREAIKFETAMADVRKAVTFDKPEQFAQMAEDIKLMSTHIPISANGIAAIVSAGGRLGIARENLQKFAMVAAKASTAWDIDPGEAGDQLANLSVRLNVPIAKIEELSDAINYLDDNTNAKAKDILEVLGRASGTFKMLKFPPELAAGFSTFANQVMVSPELAASGLQMMLQRLQMMSPAMQKALETDPKKAIFAFLDAVKKMPDDKRLAFLKKTFGDEAMRFVNQMVSSQDLLAQTLGLVGDKAKYAGSMTREFELRSQTTANQIELAKNRINVMAINLGTALLPAINMVLGAFAPMLDALGALAHDYPVLTKLVFGAAISMVVFRVATIAAQWSLIQMQLAALNFKAMFLAIPGVISMVARAIQFGVVAFRALSVAIATTPLGLILLGAGLLIQLGYALYTTWKPFADLVDTIWEGMKIIVNSVGKFFGLVQETPIGVSGAPGNVEALATPESRRQAAGSIPNMLPPALTTRSNVTLDGIININDRGGSVKSAQLNQSGANIGPLGLNMAIMR